ncbi:WASH complex subunit 2 isoform X2 [Amia ocellicauda]|uniref:WASH complex subunit 2 isoform X2 n=1 Tax=Amia ocellicauda TaxID=2972642 RepID=UPI0034642B6A
MNGLTVVNGPSEHNGTEGEHVWERPWSLEEMRKTSANWSLAADSGLLLFLQDFSQRMLSKTHEIEKQLDGLIRDTKATDSCLHTVFNDFLMLSNTQFIENRVYDEEVEEPVSKPEAGERQPEQERTREQKEAELIPKVQEAVNYGLRVLESAFEQLDIKAGNSDSEDEEVIDRVEPILEPKDLYVDRPLPYLIGSQLFMEQDDVGLGDLSSDEMSIDSDRDSVVDSEEDKDEEPSDDDFDQDDEVQDIAKKKSSLISDEEDDDEEDDSDIFGDSDKEEDEDKKNSTGPSSFADELAARIKGDVPSKEDEEQTSLSSAPSAAKKKGKGKKESKPDRAQGEEDNDELFKPPKMEDEDFSPFGGKGGLFSGGKGLFDDDDEGDLFADAPEDKISKPPVSKEPAPAIKKIPTGAVSIFPENSLFSSTKREESTEGRENGNLVENKCPSAPKQAALGGLFDDDDEDDFFSGSSLKKSNSGLEKPKQKKAVDLFGGDEEDDADIFNEISSAAPQPKNKEEEAVTVTVPEKKMPAGAISMFGPGTKNLLAESLRKRQPSTSEESEKSEKSEENVSSQDIFSTSTKPSEKSKPKSLFSDEEDSQEIFQSIQNSSKNLSNPAPVTQSKIKTPLSIFDDEEEEDLFASTPPKPTAKKSSSQKASKPLSSSLFSDDEDQWVTSKPQPTTVKTEEKSGSTKTIETMPPNLSAGVAQNKASLFDEDDDLFAATKESSQKKPQRISLLFEEENENDDDKGTLFQIGTAATPSSLDVKKSQASPLAPSLFDKERTEDLFEAPAEAKLPVESADPKKKPAGAVSLFGGFDVFGQRKPDAAKIKSPLEDPEDDEFLYKDAPPPLEEEPKSKKKNVLSLFDDDDEDEEEQSPILISSKPAVKNPQKPTEQRPRTKSTGVFQDEELLFSQTQQKDNDPDVDLFSSTGKPASPNPAPMNPAAPVLFGDDDEDDLFSSGKPKPPLKPPEKKTTKPYKDENLSALPSEGFTKAASTSPPKPMIPPKAADNKKPAGSAPVKSKEPSSRIGKLQANLAINPASLLPGASRRIPGAESVIPGPAPSQPPAQEDLPGSAHTSHSRRAGEVAVSFDTPVQAKTLQSANKGRTKGAGNRRPQTRAARQLAAQVSDEIKDEDYRVESAIGAGSTSAVHTQTPPAPDLKSNTHAIPPFPEVAVPRLHAIEKTSAKKEVPEPKLPVADEDLFGSDDLFSPSVATKELPSPKPKLKTSEGMTKPQGQLQSKEVLPSIFDDQGDDLFNSAKQKPSKKIKSIPFLEEEEDDDIFGMGKSSSITSKKETKPSTQKEPKVPKQDIFQDDIFEAESDKAAKKPKEKVLDANLFDDNVDIFADLTVTKPKEKKSKKKVETKSIFDDDMDDIFSSGTTKAVAKPQSKSKKSPSAQESSTKEETDHSIFDDPLNALGGN